MSKVTSAPTISDLIASQIRTFRKRRDMTLAQMADECARHGATHLSLSALANIERGQTAESKRRRRDVSPEELVVIARVLRVPPLLLMFPIGQDRTVELFPGQSVEMWQAALWFSGEVMLEGEQTEDWWRAPLYLHREHDRLLLDYESYLADRLFAPLPEDEQQARARQAEKTLHDLRSIRGEMRRHGLAPPELPENLQGVDERRHVYLAPGDAERILAENPGSLRYVDRSRPGAGRTIKPGEPTRIADQLSDAAGADQQPTNTEEDPA